MYAKSGIFQVYSQSCTLFYLQLMNTKIYNVIEKYITSNHALVIYQIQSFWLEKQCVFQTYYPNRFNLEFEISNSIGCLLPLSSECNSLLSQKMNYQAWISLGYPWVRFMLLKFLSVIISKEI